MRVVNSDTIPLGLLDTDCVSQRYKYNFKIPARGFVSDCLL